MSSGSEALDFCIGVAFGDLTFVQECIRVGYDIPSFYNSTPTLFFAVANGHQDVVDLLLDYGLRHDISSQCKRSWFRLYNMEWDQGVWLPWYAAIDWRALGYAYSGLQTAVPGQSSCSDLCRFFSVSITMDKKRKESNTPSQNKTVAKHGADNLEASIDAVTEQLANIVQGIQVERKAVLFKQRHIESEMDLDGHDGQQEVLCVYKENGSCPFRLIQLSQQEEEHIYTNLGQNINLSKFPSLVRIHGITDQGHIMEQYNPVSLMDSIRGDSISLSYANILAIALDLVAAVKFLHALFRIHGHIRSSGVFLVPSNVNRENSPPQYRGLLGRVYLSRPRPTVEQSGSSEHDDLYHLGVILLELLFVKAYASITPQDLASSIHTELIHLAHSCIDSNADPSVLDTVYRELKILLQSEHTGVQWRFRSILYDLFESIFPPVH